MSASDFNLHRPVAFTSNLRPMTADIRAGYTAAYGSVGPLIQRLQEMGLGPMLKQPNVGEFKDVSSAARDVVKATSNEMAFGILPVERPGRPDRGPTVKELHRHTFN